AVKKPKDELHKKLGDFYATGMDERAIEAQGKQPLAEELARIDALADLAGLPALRKQYAEHIARMLVLLGQSTADAERDAATVLALETELAKQSFGAVDFR